MKPMRAWVQWLLGLGLLGVTFVVLFPACGCRSRENARRSGCQSNLKQIALGYAQYVQDYDGHSPPVSSGLKKGWADVLQPYLNSQQLFQCPAVNNPPQDFRSDYFYNARRARLPQPKTPATVIVFGDGDDDGRTNSNLSALPPAWKTDQNSQAWRHLDGSNYAFADGHVKWFKPANVPSF